MSCDLQVSQVQKADPLHALLTVKLKFVRIMLYHVVTMFAMISYAANVENFHISGSLRKFAYN